MAKPKFKRALVSRTSELDDARGRITLVIRLTQDGGRVIPGNITRTIGIDDATVTEVADAINAALFDVRV